MAFLPCSQLSSGGHEAVLLPDGQVVWATRRVGDWVALLAKAGLKAVGQEAPTLAVAGPGLHIQ